MLPEPMRNWLLDIGTRMQCSLDLLAVPAFIMVGSVVGTVCRIRPKSCDDWEEVPNFFGAVVAPPGAMKSPALREVFKAMTRTTRGTRRNEAHEAAMKAYDLALAKYEANGRKLLLSQLATKKRCSTARPKTQRDASSEPERDIDNDLLREPDAAAEACRKAIHDKRRDYRKAP